MRIKKYIEIEVDLEVDYQPAEKADYYYPGVPESVQNWRFVNEPQIMEQVVHHINTDDDLLDLVKEQNSRAVAFANHADDRY